MKNLAYDVSFNNLLLLRAIYILNLIILDWMWWNPSELLKREVSLWKCPLTSQFDVFGVVWFGLIRDPFTYDLGLCISIKFFSACKEEVNKEPFTLGAGQIHTLQNARPGSEGFTEKISNI